MAGRQDQALERAGPDQRQVVGRARAQPRHRLDQLHLGDVGQQPVGLAQQLVDAARGDRGVEALLLDRGADDQPAVGARHEVDALGGDDPPAGRRAVAGAQLEDLALDRPHRRARALGQPLGPAGPGAGGEDDGAPRAAPRRRRSAPRRSARPRAAASATSVPVRTSTPSAAERRQQRRGQRPGVDRALARRVHAAGERRGQARLELAAAARRQPLGGEAERALQVVDAAQLRRLVAVERDVQGAAARA